MSARDPPVIMMNGHLEARRRSLKDNVLVVFPLQSLLTPARSIPRALGQFDVGAQVVTATAASPWESANRIRQKRTRRRRGFWFLLRGRTKKPPADTRPAPDARGHPFAAAYDDQQQGPLSQRCGGALDRNITRSLTTSRGLCRVSGIPLVPTGPSCRIRSRPSCCPFMERISVVTVAAWGWMKMPAPGCCIDHRARWSATLGTARCPPDHHADTDPRRRRERRADTARRSSSKYSSFVGGFRQGNRSGEPACVPLA